MKTEQITADFSVWERFPLVKTKFGFFNSAYVPYERWLKHAGLLDGVRPVSMRYELGWGMGREVARLNGNRACPQEYDAPQVRGKCGREEIVTGEMDGFTASLLQHGVQPFFILCYTPEILQKVGDSYTGVVKDTESWYRLAYLFAEHFRDSGLKIPWYEIWNEPDLKVFFDGSMEDYFRVYEMGARGVKSADPKAKVGGPALSVTASWAGPFLDYVLEHNVPLDFFSFHMFAADDQEAWIQEYRRELIKRPGLNGCEFILSEYNPLSFQHDGKDFGSGGLIERYDFAQEVMHNIRFLLGQPDIGMVNWAQFNDPSVFGESADRCGVVSVDGKRKASYQAFWIYADMPVSRCFFQSTSEEIEGMASGDAHRAAAVFWNRSAEQRQVRVSMKNIPFRIRSGKRSYIDSGYGKNSDELPFETLPVSGDKEFTWEGELPGYAVFYFLLEDGKQAGPQIPEREI